MREHSDKQDKKGTETAGPWLHLWKHVKGHFRHGFWVVVVMTALTQFLHSQHLAVVHQLDNYFTGHVVKRLHQVPGADQRVPAAGPPALSVQLLEVSPEFRIMALEDPAPDSGSIRRLQGIRPISRQAMVELLDQLADCMEGKCPQALAGAGKPQILAVDIDLMPLPGDLPDTGKAMHAAIQRLRQHLDVVLIVLPRSDIAEQQQRNQFMREAKCTRHADLATWRRPGQPGGLFLASPRLLSRVGEAPLQFAERGVSHWYPDRQQALGWFPSLGNLSYLLWHYSFAPNDESDDLPQAWQGLTQMCDQAGPDPAGSSPLLEDLIADAGVRGQAEQFFLDHWQLRFYNWRLLDSERLTFTPLSPPGDSSADRLARQDAMGILKQQLAAATLQAPVLMLAIDGGAGNDKFLTPAAVPVPITGATYHALQTLSAAQGLGTARMNTVLGLLIDALLGVFFLLSWAVLGSLLAPLHKTWPRCTRLASALMPPLLAGVIVLASLWVAAILMRCDIWFNPVYVMLGMIVHAYIEGWQHGDSPAAPIDAWGLQALRRWRRNGGLQTSQRDALAVAALRWTVLLLGTYGLLTSLIKH